MRHSISDTAEYGDLVSGPRVINADVKAEMKKVLEDIQKDKGAKFAKQWIADTDAGYKQFNELRAKEEKHPIEEVGSKLRGMMKWLAK